MQAYAQGLGGTDTRWVISPDSEFFRFFNDSDALAKPPEVRPEPPARAGSGDRGRARHGGAGCGDGRAAHGAATGRRNAGADGPGRGER